MAPEKSGPVLTALASAYMRRAQTEKGIFRQIVRGALECYQLVLSQGNHSGCRKAEYGSAFTKCWRSMKRQRLFY